MHYLVRAPAPPLDQSIESIWYYENDPRPMALERVLPGGRAQLIVNLKEDRTRGYRPEKGYLCETAPGTILSGVQTRFSVIDTSEQECVMGVSFRPGGTIPFFALPACELSDVGLSLELLWGRRGRELRERLLEAPNPKSKVDLMEKLLNEMWRPIKVHSAVQFALREFSLSPIQTSIGTVTGRIGMSPKRFIERFKHEAGITPKRYCRLVRFQRAVSMAHSSAGVDWTEVALECGYFDQPHFIHDFREFAGISPSTYDSARTEFQNHVKFLQSDKC